MVWFTNVECIVVTIKVVTKLGLTAWKAFSIWVFSLTRNAMCYSNNIPTHHCLLKCWRTEHLETKKTPTINSIYLLILNKRFERPEIKSRVWSIPHSFEDFSKESPNLSNRTMSWQPPTTRIHQSQTRQSLVAFVTSSLVHRSSLSDSTKHFS